MPDVFIGETGGWSYFSFLPAKMGAGWNLCFDGEKLEIPLYSTDVGAGEESIFALSRVRHTPPTPIPPTGTAITFAVL